MTLFHGLICGVVALYTTRVLRSPCLMMTVRKRQNIDQWSYRRVPLNVPRIRLLGYLDIDQRHTCQMKGRSGRFPGEETNYTALERARQRTGARPGTATAKPILALVSYRERSAVRRQFDRTGVSADEGAFGVDRARGG